MSGVVALSSAIGQKAVLSSIEGHRVAIDTFGLTHVYDDGETFLKLLNALFVCHGVVLSCAGGGGHYI